MTVQPGNVEPFLPETILKNVFLGNGVELVSSNYSGFNISVGLFDNAEEVIGLERGIVLSTGNAANVVKKNDQNLSSTATSGTSINDPDLEALAGVQILDVARYEMTFKPASDLLNFRYVFASEEYPKNVCAERNDAFGFFISGPKPGGGRYEQENIARVPNPDRSGDFLDLPVTINSVNGGEAGIFSDGEMCTDEGESLLYSQYYNPVPQGSQPSLNAYLDIFVAEAAVIPCESYTIKIVIGDGDDQNEDSVVFLEERSFSSTALIVDVNNPGIEGGLAEDCVSGGLSISLERPIDYDLPVELTVLTDQMVSPATPGTDFRNFPSVVTIPAGELRVEVPIVPIPDTEVEGTEFIYIALQKNLCQRDTLILPLYDNVLNEVELLDTIRLCADDTFTLEADLGDINNANSLTFNSTDVIPITPATPSVSSAISITGLKDIALNVDMIAEICIHELRHPSPNDLDIFLEAPSGQLLELSTDNGRPDLAVSTDGFVNTCFTATAQENINQGDATESGLDPSNTSYTGNYIPEGEFRDWLFPVTSTLLGNYTLYVVDDTQVHSGTLSGWHMTINPKYEVNYTWTPDTGLDCPSCDITSGVSNESRYYYLELIDSYGCELRDSVWVNVAEQIIPTQVSWQADGGFINVSWDEANGADYYEFTIPGFGFSFTTEISREYFFGLTRVTVLSPTSFVIDGLANGEEVNIQVTANNRAGCGVLMDDIVATASACPSTGLELIDFIEGNPECSTDNGTLSIQANTLAQPIHYRLEQRGYTLATADGNFSNINPGTWGVRLTDAEGCVVDTEITIDPAPVFRAESITRPECETSILTVNVEADNLPVSYEWSTGDEGVHTLRVDPGDYVVTITDASGCIITEEFEIATVPEMIPTFLQSELLDCNGEGDVTATVFTFGGTPPYRTNFVNPVTGETTETDTLLDISPGEVMWFVWDSGGCFFRDTSVVEQVAPLEVTIASLEDLGCGEAEVTLNVENAQGDINYTWSTGDNTQSVLLQNGPASVTVTDNNGCMADLSVLISDTIAISEIITNPSCAGANDGHIDVEILGGNGMYDLAWSNGDAGQTTTDLSAGQFCLTITDTDGCLEEKCFTLSDPESISVEHQSTSPLCSNLNSGSILLSTSGGSGQYSYEWSGPDNFSSNTQSISDLGAGSYTVTVKDLRNPDCSPAQLTITLDQENDMMAGVNVLSDVYCDNSLSGTLEANITGGMPPFTYTWSHGVEGATADDLTPGSYTVTVTDLNGCTAASTLEIGSENRLEVVLIGNDIKCFGEDSGNVQAVVTGGQEPYEITWSNGMIGESLPDLAEGSYTATIHDASGCTITESIQIISTEEEIVLSCDITDVTCFGTSDGSILVNAENATLPIEYILGSQRQTHNLFSNLAAGEYLVQIIDANGCEQSTLMEVRNAPEILIDLVTENEVARGTDVTLEVEMLNTTGSINYEWKAPDPSILSCLDCSTPVISGIENSFSGSVVILDELGCSQEKHFSINVVEKNNLAVPTGFTPDNNNVNDILQVYGDPNLRIINFSIYNREGSKVYEQSDFTTADELGWDGRFHGDASASGSYIWTLEFEKLDGSIDFLRGQTTLIR